DVSKIHCQLALRQFWMPKKEGSGSKASVDPHEEPQSALFLRDVSRNKMLVNGAPAFRPWHWLQEEDVIGLQTASGDSQSLYKVKYNVHRKIPGHI
ncbi:unnamed protein product, partial [Polarella glacialis]